MALSLVAETESVDSENWFFEYKLQEYKASISNLIFLQTIQWPQEETAGLSDFLWLLSSFTEKIGLDFKAIIVVYRHWYWRKRERSCELMHLLLLNRSVIFRLIFPLPFYQQGATWQNTDSRYPAIWHFQLLIIANDLLRYGRGNIACASGRQGIHNQRS